MGADGEARLADAIFVPCGDVIAAEFEGELYWAC